MELHHYIEVFAHWLHVNPQWGALAAFLAAFLESIAVIGTIIPGSVTMTAIGILIGSGIIPIISTLILVIIGAITGDIISYFFGYYFKDRLESIWPFSKNPKILDYGKHFFTKHGGKSIVLGRFIGLIRSFIPMIAGMLNMRPIKFFPVDILAAILWAPVYLFPGFLIGVASLALPANIASQLIVVILVALVIFWLCVWAIRKLSIFTGNKIDQWLNRIWDRMLARRHWHWACNFLRDAERPHHHGQLVLAFSCIVSAIVFLFILANVLFHGPLLHLNQITYHLLRSVRAPLIDHFMAAITLLGQKEAILPVVGVVFIYLLITKRKRAACHWLLAFILCLGPAFILRHAFYSVRPFGIMTVKASSSFPSGHVVIATTFYGFLAWMLCLRNHKIKKPLYAAAATIICLVMLSRLYLGEHWLTDILGSFLLSFTACTLAAISYQRHFEKSPRITSMSIVTGIALLIFVLGYGFLNYQKIMQDTAPNWRQQTLSDKAWWKDDPPMVPAYRLNRLGFPTELLNIQWTSHNITDIQHELRNHHWLNIHSHKAKHLIKILEKEHVIYRLNILPFLFMDQKPYLVMIKMVDPHKPPLVLRLWPAHIMVMPEKTLLWLGTLNFQRENKHLLFHRHLQVVPKAFAQQLMSNSLNNKRWQIVARFPTGLPKHFIKDHTHHYTILIRPKN